MHKRTHAQLAGNASHRARIMRALTVVFIAVNRHWHFNRVSDGVCYDVGIPYRHYAAKLIKVFLPPPPDPPTSMLVYLCGWPKMM